MVYEIFNNVIFSHVGNILPFIYLKTEVELFFCHLFYLTILIFSFNPVEKNFKVNKSHILKDITKLYNFMSNFNFLSS